METIVTSAISEITLSSNILVLNTDIGDMEINVKKLLKEPVNSENAYFNATKIAKHFNKDVRSYMKNAGKEYIDVVNAEFNCAEMAHLKLKTHYTKRGKYYSGTWLHKEIFLDFCRWLDKKFARKMDVIIRELIIHSNEIKIERSNTKFNFKGLTDTIKDIYIPAQDSDNKKKWAYPALATLINIKALGCKASKFIVDNNLNPDEPIRDQISKEKVAHIDKLEEDLNGYIKYANITDYEILKEKLI